MKHLLPLLLIIASLTATAQTVTPSPWHLHATAGLNIGGAAPLPLPVEIRQIKGFNPHLNPTVSLRASYDLSHRWSLNAAVGYERMAMTTQAGVKSYHTEISSEGNTIAGVWTGDVETTYKTSALTVPLTVGFRLGRHVSLAAGVYASYLFGKEFGGKVYNGYLRHGDPTGEKVVFDGDASASYAFNDELRTFNYGVIIGIDYALSSRLALAAHVEYSFASIFNDDFATITFAMHPIYGNLSLSYRIF